MLVLTVDRVKAGDTAGALKQAAALPSEGVHRFIGPFALAWTRMAAGDLAGADTALQGLDKFNGFQPLKVFQLGLLYDFAGKRRQGAGIFTTRRLAASGQLNWRLTDVDRQFPRAPRPRRAGARRSTTASSSRTAAAIWRSSVAARAPPARPSRRSARPPRAWPRRCSIWRAC